MVLKTLYFLTVLSIFGTLIGSQVSHAGPLGCANAIKSCVGGGKKIADKIKASRQACEALRDCKNVCKGDKRETKSDARQDKKACLDSCKDLSGKKKRHCKSECRQDKRSDFKDARQDKRSCVQVCRDQYKTKACKKARRQMALTITAQGLKCAAQVTAQCAPAAP